MQDASWCGGELLTLKAAVAETMREIADDGMACAGGRPEERRTVGLGRSRRFKLIEAQSAADGV